MLSTSTASAIVSVTPAIAVRSEGAFQAARPAGAGLMSSKQETIAKPSSSAARHEALGKGPPPLSRFDADAHVGIKLAARARAAIVRWSPGRTARRMAPVGRPSAD